jgi:membrane-associated protein
MHIQFLTSTLAMIIFGFTFNVEALLSQYGQAVYLVMFLIIFCETGLVVTPVLPGDSMIFAAAALSARTNSVLNVHLIAVLMLLAAFSGDTVNYFVGRWIGPRVYRKNYRLLSKQRLHRTKAFYKKYGVPTIVYARFIPVIRTFAPFIAGVSDMRWATFLRYNLLGGFLWVALYTYCGYLFGNLSWVQKHLGITLLLLFVLTLIPAGYAVSKTGLWKKKGRGRRKTKTHQG